MPLRVSWSLPLPCANRSPVAVDVDLCLSEAQIMEERGLKGTWRLSAQGTEEKRGEKKET